MAVGFLADRCIQLLNLNDQFYMFVHCLVVLTADHSGVDLCIIYSDLLYYHYSPLTVSISIISESMEYRRDGFSELLNECKDV